MLDASPKQKPTMHLEIPIEALRLCEFAYLPRDLHEHLEFIELRQKGGMIRVVANNGHVAGIFEFPGKIEQPLYLHAASIKLALKGVSRDTTALVFDGHALRKPGQSIEVRTDLPGTYPEIDRVTPETGRRRPVGDLGEIGIDLNYLSLIQKYDKKTGGSGHAKFDFGGPRDPIRVTVKNGAVFVVMPRA